MLKKILRALGVVQISEVERTNAEIARAASGVARANAGAIRSDSIASTFQQVLLGDPTIVWQRSAWLTEREDFITCALDGSSGDLPVTLADGRSLRDRVDFWLRSGNPTEANFKKVLLRYPGVDLGSTLERAPDCIKGSEDIIFLMAHLGHSIEFAALPERPLVGPRIH